MLCPKTQVRMLSWTLASLFHLYLPTTFLISYATSYTTQSFSWDQSRSSYCLHSHLVLIAKWIDVSCFLEACADPEITSFSNYKGIIKCEGPRVVWRLWPCFLSVKIQKTFQTRNKTATQNLIPLNRYSLNHHTWFSSLLGVVVRRELPLSSTDF